MKNTATHRNSVIYGHPSDAPVVAVPFSSEILLNQLLALSGLVLVGVAGLIISLILG